MIMIMIMIINGKCCNNIDVSLYIAVSKEYF